MEYSAKFKKTLSTLHKTIADLKKSIPHGKNIPRQKTAVSRSVSHPVPTTNISFSFLTIFKATATVLIVIFLANIVSQVVDIIILLFIAGILAAAFMPLVDYFSQHRVPRSLTILIIYFLLFAIFALIISSFVPLLSEQISSLSVYLRNVVQDISTKGLSGIPFSHYLEPILEHFDQDQLILQFQRTLEGLSSQLQNISGGVFQIATGIFGGVFSFMTVLVVTFYMIMEKSAVTHFFRGLVPSQHEQYLSRISSSMQLKIGAWIRGQLLLCAAIGILVFIGLIIIGVPYAHTLALTAAILEIVPYVGPILAAIIAILIALTVSPLLALLTIFVFAIIQFLENNFLVPMIMRRAIGVNPLAIICAILIGAKTIGVLGVVLAVPVVTAISVFIAEYTQPSATTPHSPKTPHFKTKKNQA